MSGVPWWSRVRSHLLKGLAGGSCELSAKLLPSLGCVRRAEPDVPLACYRWRGDAVKTLRAHESAGVDFARVLAIQRHGCCLQKFRIRVNFGRGLPGSNDGLKCCQIAH
jgi:hypothetical protein